MPQSVSPLAAGAQRALGRARLVYWDDADLSAALQSDTDRLGEPLALGVWAASDADRAALTSVVEAIAPEGVRMVEYAPDAQLAWQPPRDAAGLLAPRAVVTVTSGGAGTAVASGRSRIVLDLARAAAWAHSLRPDADATNDHAREGAAHAPDPAAEPGASTEPEVTDSGVAAEPEPLAEPEDVAALRTALADLAADAHALTPLGVVGRLRTTLAERPRRGSEAAAAELAALDTASEEQELDAAIGLRAGVLEGLDADASDRARALLAAAPAWGTGWGLARPSIDPDAELRWWRAQANDLTLPRGTREAARTLARLCERLLAA